jgi:hypothetical protein
MAARNLPVFTHPGFAQVLNSLVSHQVRVIERALSLCSYEEPESSRGACNGGYPCQETATVTDLDSGGEFCLSHFREVSRA